MITTDHLLRLGTSGWAYKDWIGNFYPEKTPQSKWLEYYVTQFNTVEVDSTFYAIPPRERVEKWRETAPEGFEFALKVPQVITHEKSLRDCDDEMREFLDVISVLGKHLGPVLFQFPYGFKPDRLEDLLMFLDQLPLHDFRFVVEIRNRGWFKTKLLDELAARNIPSCNVDHPWMPRRTDVTGSFVYVRFLGDQDKITEFGATQFDRQQDLHWWAEAAQEWVLRRVPIYAFFNNHFSGHGPTDARMFSEILRQLRERAPA